MPHRSRHAEDLTSVYHGRSGLGSSLRRFFGRGPSPEERLEQAVAGLRRELDEYVARFEETMSSVEQREASMRDSRASVERLLRRGTEELDEREEELVRLTRELEERESKVAELESEVAKRRGELGAVELKRAALEQRERSLAAREAATTTSDTREELPTATPPPEPEAEPKTEEEPGGLVLFVPGPSYRLVEIESETVSPGALLELDGVEYVVSRIGPSPLPSDPRRCAYLVRGAPGRAASGGSS